MRKKVLACSEKTVRLTFGRKRVCGEIAFVVVGARYVQKGMPMRDLDLMGIVEQDWALP